MKEKKTYEVRRFTYVRKNDGDDYTNFYVKDQIKDFMSGKTSDKSVQIGVFDTVQAAKKFMRFYSTLKRSAKTNKWFAVVDYVVIHSYLGNEEVSTSLGDITWVSLLKNLRTIEKLKQRYFWAKAHGYPYKAPKKKRNKRKNDVKSVPEFSIVK